jgi:hypothetical protein
VYRLGGTSHDVSVVSVINGMYRIIAYERDGTLGGRNFDELIVHHLALEFKRLVVMKSLLCFVILNLCLAEHRNMEKRFLMPN